MKDKPMVSLILIHELYKTSSVSLPDHFVFFPSTSRVSEQEVTVSEALADLVLVYAMACQVTPVKAERFHAVSGILSRPSFVK